MHGNGQRQRSVLRQPQIRTADGDRSKEQPAALQIFGSDPDIMGEMAAKVDNGKFQMIDINMGCPVPKIVNNGDGSALMKQPELAGRS